MPDCLVYWQTYWRRLTEEGCRPDTPEADRIATAVWQTRRKDVLRQLRPGDSLWVVISGDGLDQPEEWRLIQRIHVADWPKYVEELKGSEYGPYQVKGNRAKSALFRISRQPDFAAILRLLKFARNRPIKATGRDIGIAIEAIRPLAHSDCVLLENYAKTLKTR